MEYSNEERQFKRLFIVEPDKDLNEAFKDAFENEGIEVRSFLKFEELLEALKFQAPDAVIMDFQLPVVVGKEMFERLEGHAPRLPVYMMTAVDVDQLVILDLAISGVFYKPFHPRSALNQLKADFNRRAH